MRASSLLVLLFAAAGLTCAGCTTLSTKPTDSGQGGGGWFGQKKEPSSISPDLNSSYSSSEREEKFNRLGVEEESSNPLKRTGTAIAESRVVRGMKSAAKRTGAAVTGLFVKSANPEEDDEISLNRPTPEATPDIFIAAARVKSVNGPSVEAEKLYREALEIEPGHLEASLEMARMLDQTERSTEALTLYRNAVKRHPNAPNAHNDLGLFLAKHKEYDQASQELAKAVKLEPEKKLYRNNLAAVLLAQGRKDEALKQLLAVHPPAVAHYNVGYMLSQSGDIRGGLDQIDLALQSDPTMPEAREYREVLLAQLPGPVGQHFLARRQFREQAQHEVASRPAPPVGAQPAAAPAP